MEKLWGTGPRLQHLRDEHVAKIVALIAEVAPAESADLFAKLQQRVNHDFFRGVDLFSTVLPERPFDDALQNDRVKIFHALHGRNARLLELGPWSAWPDERVREFLLLPPHHAGGFSEFIRLDFDDTYSPDIAASCYAIPLAEGSVDFVRSNSLLEHVRDTHSTLKECYRVLSPGGIMQHTMPLHFVLHGYPKDYSRLSPDYFTEVCAELGFEDVFVSVSNCSGRMYTSLNFLNSFRLDIGGERAALVEMAKALLLLVSELDGYDGDRDAVAHSIHVTAKKPGTLATRAVERDAQGILQIAPATTTLSRMAAELVSPVTKQPLRYDGHALTGDKESYPVRDGKCALLRATDAVPH